MSRLFLKDELLRLAISLGYTITPGRKHWHASHPNGGSTIIPFGRKRSSRSHRNIESRIRRNAA